MNSKSPIPREEFSARYFKLIKPLYKANIDHMYSLISDKEIKNAIHEARKALGISDSGRKPNSINSYHKEMRSYKDKFPILLHTTTLLERNILKEHVDKMISKFDIYEHFKEGLETYIVHNLVFAPDHNVKISFKLRDNGRSALPTIHFYRKPYVNDWEIAKLFVENNKHMKETFIDRLSDKFKKSYRGSKDLDKRLKITNEAANRRRISADASDQDTPYNITNSEIAENEDVYNDAAKGAAVKKVLSRQRRRTREMTSH